MMLRLVCSSVHLSRREDNRKKSNDTVEVPEPTFIGEECHTYSYPFCIRKIDKITGPVKLNVTSITLPDGKSFNTGASLEKWAKKRPRLKSTKSQNQRLDATSSNEATDYIDYDSLQLGTEFEHYPFEEHNDLSELESLLPLEYEIHSDIEELILQSQRNEEKDEPVEELELCKKHNRYHKKKRKDKDKSSKKKEKRKKKKTIKFSISKPPSPETEQVIRVDVVSNVTVEESISPKSDSERKESGRYLQKIASQEERVFRSPRRECEKIDSIRQEIATMYGRSQELELKCRKVPLMKRSS